jgi:hypothetical protein
MTLLEGEYSHYTVAALEDELVKAISSHNVCYLEKDENGNDCIRIKWDYIDQAQALLYKINLYDPLPEYVIFAEDISNKLAKALKSLGKIMMKKVITNAVRRIYESVDPEYFHTNCVYGKIKWRLAF